MAKLLFSQILFTRKWSFFVLDQKNAVKIEMGPTIASHFDLQKYQWGLSIQIGTVHTTFPSICVYHYDSARSRFDGIY
jgi:hypothetical protein